MNINKILEERGQTHGDFSSNALIAQQLKEILRGGDSWDCRTAQEKETIEMICHKLARWVNAPKFHKDNPVDIAGYATLVAERL